MIYIFGFYVLIAIYLFIVAFHQRYVFNIRLKVIEIIGIRTGDYIDSFKIPENLHKVLEPEFQPEQFWNKYDTYNVDSQIWNIFVWKPEKLFKGLITKEDWEKYYNA